MSCPNCAAEMSSQTIDSQTVLHCPNCGGTFFGENGINRITAQSAARLAERKKSDEVSGQAKHCPKDQQILQPITDSALRLRSGQADVIDEPIPQGVTLLRCPTCKGIFAFADDLVKFKQAQEAKVNYFRAWNLPLPSLRAVLLLSFFLVLSIGFFSRLNSFLQYSSQQSQASDLIKKVGIIKSGRYIHIFFKTERPFRAKIVFTDRTENTLLEKPISSTPKTLHQLTTADLKSEDELYYRITLIDNNGNEIITEEKRLKIDN